jgi:thiol-disulfide isomerase/thioredoxin
MKMFLGILFFFSLVFAQEKTQLFTFELISEQKLSDKDVVFIAGSFNNWTPNDPQYSMTRSGKKWQLKLELQSNLNYEYKYTLGSWEEVELDANFGDVANRVLLSGTHISLSDTVKYWASSDPNNNRYVRRLKRDLDLFKGKALPDIKIQQLDQEFKPTKISYNQELASGKLTIINFWSISCPPCKPLMKTLNTLRNEVNDDINILMLAREINEPEKVGEMAKENSPNLVHAMTENDKETPFIYSFKIDPMTLIVSKEGKLLDYFLGPKSLSELKEIVKKNN